MVRSWERDGCWGVKLDLAWIFHGMYRRFGVIPQVFLLLLPFLFFGDFRSLFLEFSFVARFIDLRMFLSWFLWGDDGWVPCASLWMILTPQRPDLAFDSLTFGWTLGHSVLGKGVWDHNIRAYPLLGVFIISPKFRLKIPSGLGDPSIKSLGLFRGLVF
jgi:hypothetical protein